ncbi:CwfJ C-terminus 1-domain-containing protein-like protein [Obelidium mucronatum]|nr:CwfJ C-terminus 1-domain-containing protein-like protein [Obelidium mucronatum]
MIGTDFSTDSLSSGANSKKRLVFCIGSGSSGDFQAAISKVNALHAKHGPFDFALATGDFFAAFEQDAELGGRLAGGLIKGEWVVPCPLYVVGGRTPVPAAVHALIAHTGQIATNVFFLGASGVFATAEGLQIAYVSHAADAAALAAATRTVDILLAAAVPAGVAALSALPVDQSLADHAVARVAACVRPRYLFAASPSAFAEREPYKNARLANEKDSVVTRFISLASYSKTKKDRWFYAFNIVPLKDLDQRTLYMTPENTTPSPFSITPSNPPPRFNPAAAAAAAAPNSRKRALIDDSVGDAGQGGFFWNNPADSGQSKKSQKKTVPPSHYVCNACHVPGHWLNDCPQRVRAPPTGYICHLCKKPDHFVAACPAKLLQKQNRQLDRDPATCWFCLSSPNIEKHLLVDIKEDCYIASAKGGLSEWGGHMLIIPINHFESRVQILDNDVMLREIYEIQQLIIQRFDAHRQEVPVFFEVFPGHPGGDTVRRVQHLHIQVIPIPRELIFTLRDRFMDAAAAASLVAMPNGALPADPNTPYVRIELPDQPLGGEPLVLTMPVNGNPRAVFNQQFARRVLAEALGAPHKAAWKNCTLSHGEEAQLTQNMKVMLG